MGRDGSDSDYLIENGFGFLVKGEVPDWGDKSEEEFVKFVVDFDQIFFDSFQEAKTWAQSNPGEIITRSPDGRGFVVKK